MDGQSHKTKGTAFGLLLSLYVDNASFHFESKQDMARGTTLIYHHMRRFGLLMHIFKAGMEENPRQKPSTSPQACKHPKQIGTR
jgi:hypothetical protein